MSDLAEEMANYKSELEDYVTFYNRKFVALQWLGVGGDMYRTSYKQWNATNSSQYNADPLSPGYGQPTSTTNGTDPGFPAPTAPANPGRVNWGASPLEGLHGISPEVIKAWGDALAEPGHNVTTPPIMSVCVEVPTKPPTTMYVCLSHGCPERAPSPSCEICYTCGKVMSQILMEEVVPVPFEKLPPYPINPNKITMSFKGTPFEGMMDGEFVTHERTGGVIDVKKGVIAGMDNI